MVFYNDNNILQGWGGHLTHVWVKGCCSGSETLTMFGEKCSEIPTLFRTTPSILGPCLRKKNDAMHTLSNLGLLNTVYSKLFLGQDRPGQTLPCTAACMSLYRSYKGVLPPPSP